MSSSSLALQWYQPAEILVLKRWLVFAILINLSLIIIEFANIRASELYLVTTGVLCLIIIRLLLHRTIQKFKRRLMLFFSIAAISFAITVILKMDFSLYNFWALGWLLIPALTTFIGLLMGSVKAWSNVEFTENDAQNGLKRNNHILPKYEDFSAHIILLHGLLVVLLPITWIFDISISPGNALDGLIGDAFSLEHYVFILTNSSFYLWLKNSVIISVGTVIISMFFAIPAGYAFSRYNFSGRKQTMRLFMLIQMFPGAIILVPYFMVMKTLGLLNSSIGLIIIYSVSALPISVWMLKGYFDNIPREIEEAAMLDGCNQFQIFYRVILPLSITAIAVTSLIAFLAAWNEFLLSLVFNTSSDMFTLPVGLVSLIPATGQQWGDFAAASILVSTPVVILFIYFQKSLISGLSSGSVKG